MSLGSPVSAWLHPQGGAEAPQRVEVAGGTLAEARANPLPAPGDVAIRSGDVVVTGAGVGGYFWVQGREAEGGAAGGIGLGEQISSFPLLPAFRHFTQRH